MKKLLSLLIATMMIISLAACGGGAAEQSTPAGDGGTQDSDAGAAQNDDGGDAQQDAGSGDYGDIKLVLMVSAFGDLSFMDAARTGVERLEQLGFQTQYIECGDDTSRYQAYVLDICDSGADYLICGGTYQDFVEAAAPDYPDMRFILFDTAREIDNPQPNVFYMSYAQNEGSFLVGMVAAAMSESGVIGTIGGMQNPTICDFMVGYMAGAQAYNPDIKVVSGFMGNWTDTAMMQELYTAQYNSYRADVCFPLSGNAGIGVFEAAYSLGTYAIGVDSDMYALYSAQGNDYAEVIVTSMLKEVGNSIYSSMMRVMDGEDIFGTAEIMGLSTGSVGYVDDAQFRSLVDAADIAIIEATAQQIANGEISVPSYYDFASEDEYTAYVNSFAP